MVPYFPPHLTFLPKKISNSVDVRRSYSKPKQCSLNSYVADAIVLEIRSYYVLSIKTFVKLIIYLINSQLYKICVSCKGDNNKVSRESIVLPVLF